MGLVIRRLPLLLGAALLMQCTPITADISDLACGNQGACANGYTCHPQQRVCVPKISISCTAAGGICPTSIQTGDTCPVAGAYIDCVADATNCASGCRTCSGSRQWGACQVTSQCPTDLPLELCSATPGNHPAQEPFLLSAGVCASAGLMASGTTHATQCLGGPTATPSTLQTLHWQSGPVFLIAR